MHASGGVVIFVKQGLSFFELSTSSLSSLDPYSDYAGVNISLNSSYSLSFFNVYAPLFISLRRIAKPTPFLYPFFSPEISLFWGLQLPSTPLGFKRYFQPSWGESIRLGHLLPPPNDSDTPTLLHCSTGSRSSPDISFAPSSLAFFCSREVLQDLGSDHLPILLSIPLP